MKSKDVLCPICNQQKEIRSKTCSRACSSIFIKQNRKYRVSKEELEKAYFEDKLEWNDIAKRFNLSIAGIHKYMKRYGIEYLTKKDISGQTFGKLTVINLHSKKNRCKWLCKCECGALSIKSTTELTNGNEPKCIECAHLSRREPDIIKTTLWNRYINGAKSRNLEFSITKEYAYELYINQNKKCALSGEPIVFSPSQGKKSRMLTTASLDRIDSTKGYIEGNVQWVHKVVNKLKLNYKQDDLIFWCKKISEYNEKNKVL